jgi:hypothetical protein
MHFLLSLIGGSWDKMIQRWDLRRVKEIRRIGRFLSMWKQWGYQEMADGLSLLVLGGIKVSEVETGIMRTFLYLCEQHKVF